MNSFAKLAIFFVLAVPAVILASSGGHEMRSAATPVHAQAPHERRNFAGAGANGTESTLLSGTLPAAPDEEEGTVVPPPPYPPYPYPYYAQYVPRPCVRPVLIHIAPPRPAKNLPRLIYGVPFDCTG
jgi:hypothetical protein